MQQASRVAPALLRSVSSAAPLGHGFARYASAAAGTADKVAEVSTDTDFKKALDDVAASGSLMVCDFTAKWCGPCRMIAPIYSKLSTKYPHVSFVKIDIDNNAVQSTVTDHSITGVPTFVFYKGGRRVESFSGARPDLLEDLVRKHAPPPKSTAAP